MNALSTQRPSQQASSSRSAQPQPPPQPPPQQAPQSISAATHTGRSVFGTDEAMSRSDSGDGSALPSSASWAAKNAHIESRRSSKPASVAASSPVVAPAAVSAHAVEQQRAPSEPEKSTLETLQSAIPTSATDDYSWLDGEPSPNAFEGILKTVTTSNYKFVFDRSLYDSETMKRIEACPDLFDPQGGRARYIRAKAQEKERQKQEEERNVLGAMSAAEEEDEEAPASGSLQLGGEPETQDGPPESAGRRSAHQHTAIQPPFASSSAFPFSGPSFQTSNNLSRTLTPQQQQHLSLLRSQSNRQSPVSSNQYPGYTGTTSLHHHQQSNPFQMQNQSQAFSTAQGHARQASRFAFANDSSASTAIKPVGNPQLMAQQSAMMPSAQGKHFQNQSLQQSGMHSNHFYSGVQGPPPGLKSSGTPPISGGGMFGQGHGFAVAMGGSAGFGNNTGTKNSNEEIVRELMRTRNGSVNGQGPDVGKREFKFPFSQQPVTSDAPASSLLSSLYGSQLGTQLGYQDHNLQKQKKKGKKHRHANTSSSGGGGIVDLADPSILQARMHHGAAGQGHYGTQGQGGFNPNTNSMIYGGGYGGRWQM